MSETPQILLAHHLKKLKLPTFLREHEKIARLCAAENMDHTRYLLRLAELELIDREGRIVVALNTLVFGFAAVWSLKTKSDVDWFLGGRNLPFWLIGMSMFATSVDGGEYVAINGDYRS